MNQKILKRVITKIIKKMKKEKSVKKFVKITNTDGMAENIIHMMQGKLELIREIEEDGMLFGVIQNSKDQKCKLSAINYESIKKNK